MNYSKKGIRAKQKSLNAKSTKFGRKLLLAVMNLTLLCILAAGIIGISLGLGVFKGIIDTSPSIENVKVTPTGFSTFVYDLSVEKYHNYAVDLGDESAIYVHNTFSLLYGAMEDSFAKNYCNGDMDYAHMVYGGFFEAYPRVKEWVDERHQEVQRDHRVSLELSNRFIQILPEGEGKGALNSMLRKSQNYPIQAQSADLTGCVMYDLQQYIEENHMKSLIVMYVHDSIEVDVYPYELIQLVDKLKFLLNDSPMRRMGLPSKADVTLGQSLGHEIDMKSIEYNEDFTEGVISLKGYKDEIYETIETWKKAYKTVEILEESWKDEFVSMGELFILRKAYTPTLGTLRHKGECKVQIKYYT